MPPQAMEKPEVLGGSPGERNRQTQRSTPEKFPLARGGGGGRITVRFAGSARCPVNFPMVVVAQLVELQIVVLAVAGSSPVDHPRGRLFSRPGRAKRLPSPPDKV